MDRRARPRPRWEELPAALRGRIEGVLGSVVAGAESREGGWSPGSADRLVLGDGRRAFVKAADAELNAETVQLHRREAEVLALLGGSGTAPSLTGTVEDGSWFALVTEDVGGRHPDPTVRSEVVAVLDAVRSLPRADRAARTLLAAVDLASEAAGWRRLIDDDALGTVPIDGPSAAALDALTAAHAPVLAGDRIVHGDLRFAPPARPTPPLRVAAGPRRAGGPTPSSTTRAGRTSSTGPGRASGRAGSTPSRSCSR